MTQTPFKKTAAGKYKASKINRQNPQTINLPIQPPLRKTTQSNPTKTNQKQQNRSTTTPKNQSFLEQVRREWKQKNLNTQTLDKMQGFINVLGSKEGKDCAKKALQGMRSFVQKIPLQGVMNAMGKDKNLNDMLKSLGENVDTSELLKGMMNDPEMKQTAMDMMQEMMSDEKKLSEMTEMMSKMLKKD